MDMGGPAGNADAPYAGPLQQLNRPLLSGLRLLALVTAAYRSTDQTLSVREWR